MNANGFVLYLNKYRADERKGYRKDKPHGCIFPFFKTQKLSIRYEHKEINFPGEITIFSLLVMS